MIVNRILPDSAAQSSDLQIGDKLLTINGDNISSLSQAQVVKLLKACPSGAPVLLGVSRQVRKQRKSPEETEEEEDRFTVNSKVLEMFKGATEVCSFNISMENTSLGIQLKGTQQNNSSLSGLFVDKILTTGAAFKVSTGKNLVAGWTQSLKRGFSTAWLSFKYLCGRRCYPWWILKYL